GCPAKHCLNLSSSASFPSRANSARALAPRCWSPPRLPSITSLACWLSAVSLSPNGILRSSRISGGCPRTDLHLLCPNHVRGTKSRRTLAELQLANLFPLDNSKAKGAAC